LSIVTFALGRTV